MYYVVGGFARGRLRLFPLCVHVPVLVSDLQHACLVFVISPMDTREISSSNRRWESRRSTHSQRLERNTRLETKSGHASNPYFHRLVGVSFLIGRSNTPKYPPTSKEEHDDPPQVHASVVSV